MNSNAAISHASKSILPGSRRGLTPASFASEVPAGIELWMLLLTQFDPTQGQFSTQQIARVLGINPWAVSFHCRKLWPREKGEPREVRSIDFGSLVWLVRHYEREGRKLPDARALYSNLRGSRQIGEQFPRDCPAVCQGTRIVEAKRRSILAGS